MDVWEYFGQREAECADMSVDCRDLHFYAEEGTGDQVGTMLGHVYFDDRTYLDIHERVEVRGNSVHRTDYAYCLVMDGVEYWLYERDPTHDPPVHRHTLSHAESLEAEPVSFKHVCKLAWREVSLRDAD
jgi:hypothetical protein